MNKYNLLITNDDGKLSPLLVPFFQALGACPWAGDLRIVVPAYEQSWIAQAATRLRPLRPEKQVFDSFSGFSVDGSPADCVSLGIDNLFEGRPDFVFSGINIGTNTGLPFYLSSGTVGGARQAFLCGLRAAAVSVRVAKPVISAWVERDAAALAAFEADWLRIGRTAAHVLGRLVAADAWQHADFFSINIPWEADSRTDIVLTGLERRSYGSLFKPLGDGTFVHSFQGYHDAPERPVLPQPLLPGDIAAVEQGFISLSPIIYQLHCGPVQKLLQEFPVRPQG